MEEGNSGGMPGRRTLLGSTRLDSTRTCPPRTVGKKESVLYHGLASVQNHHDSMAGVFRVLRKRERRRVRSRGISDISYSGAAFCLDQVFSSRR